MTDLRAQRTAVLAAAAKAKSHAKAEAADQAIRRLIRRGEPVTFQAVQREAGVSHAFLYGNPELRARIEHLRDQARPRPAQPAGNDRIRYSHGGAILLGGFRGTGKTTLVASALRQLKNELTDEYVVVSTINVARPMSSTELLFTIMRRLVEALDDAGVMSLLDSGVRSTLLLSYARTSLSLSRQSTESAERSTTTGLSVSNPLSPLGKSGLGLSPRLEKTTKTSRSLAVEASFLAYADGDVEHDFARIVQLIAENPIKIAKRWAPWKRIEKPVRLIVVLDELDKLTATDRGIEPFSSWW
jgi:Cdc6-like AAA superfamily ATPase